MGPIVGRQDLGIGNNFLRFIAQPLGTDFKKKRVITIGRQTNYASNDVQDQFLEFGGFSKKKEVVPAEGDVAYFDEIFDKVYQDCDIDSIDYSDFEGASVVHDLNCEIPPDLREQYDVLIDGGTAEHIWDVKRTFFNYLSLVKPNGHLFINVPANNQFGHGFYQFSAEFFFSFFTENYGCEVVTAVLDVHPYLGGELASGKLYEVESPLKIGERVVLCNKKPTSILVHIRKLKAVDLGSQTPPIQSDYSSRYEENSGQPLRRSVVFKLKLKGLFKKIPKKLQNHIIGLGQRAYYSTWNRKLFKKWRAPF